MEIPEPYQIVRPLQKQQQRKFGALFIVRNKENGLLGILKMITKTEGTATPSERLRAESTFHFPSKGLPHIYDVFETKSNLIVIRNYIHGATVEEHFNTLKRRKRHAFLCEVLTQLDALLTKLHQERIYHCDIKPSNLIWDEEETLHLIDFGLALQQPITQNRKLLFPLGYAAPELLLNRLHLIDHRTDYFAVGIAIWRLYSGKLPLPHPNPSIFTNLQLTHPLPESFDVPNRIQTILEKMCVKHSFEVPPNRLPLSQVDEDLKAAMEQRYMQFSDFVADFRNAGPRNLFTKQYRNDSQY